MSLSSYSAVSTVLILPLHGRWPWQFARVDAEAAAAEAQLAAAAKKGQ